MENTKQPIDFKPLSDGLGFHPFADGLPYAPVVKQVQKRELPLPAALNPDPSHLGAPLSQMPMGTGAIAAGRAMPVKQGQGPVAAPARTLAKGPARVNVPVATANVAGIATPTAVPTSSSIKSAL